MTDPQKQYKSPQEHRINQYLRTNVKIDQLDPEIQQQYNNTQSKPSAPKITYWEQFLMNAKVQKSLKQIGRFRRESLPMLLFVGFSTYMLIKMENQYDEMKQKIHNSKTLKELEIEQEDAYIRNALEGKRVNLDVQIQEPKAEQKYKFEEEDDELPGFDTEEDFFAALQKDEEQGLPVPVEYQEQYKKYKGK